ncbi:MAG TPA: NAD(P)H-dependent oxidoreductase [Epulopiscium sp.]|nr:NAD(P)H-dependent oxidoreductase [Candidatus Epulonipiscium sp.]
MTKIAIIIGSTRPGRNGEAVGKWVYEQSKNHRDAEFELVDLAEYNLPLLDEPYPAMMQQYSKDHTKKWAEKIKSFDGYIIVTPEYNHSTSAALKNAIDYLNVEWADKAAGFVSYGSAGGARAVEHLRQIFAELRVATVRDQVMFSLFTDFVDMSEFKPASLHNSEVDVLFNQVISWSNALKTIRK